MTKEYPLAKCQPKSIDHLFQDITVKLFYHHAKEIVLSGTLNIDESVLLKLASLQAIASYGPFITDVQDLFVRKLLQREKFFPTDYDVTDDHLPSEVKTKISGLYSQLGSMLKEDAMEEYLNVAALISGFGVDAFKVTFKSFIQLCV